MKRNPFSLIELLIVIVIIGALAVMILPKFGDLETTAKDTACDYNNAGIARYVQMFREANGVYPAGFHTGMNSATGGVPVQNKDGADAMAKITHLNVADATTELDGEGYFKSLAKAGIVSLAYGTKSAELLGNDYSSPVVKPRAVNGDWFEDMMPDGQTRDLTATPVSINGYPLSDWVQTGSDPSTTSDTQRAINRMKKEFKVVPLFVASTVDWEYAVKNGRDIESKVGLATPAKCPWLNSGEFRYYICFFKVFSDGEPAQFIASSCPECGVLDADTF